MEPNRACLAIKFNTALREEAACSLCGTKMNIVSGWGVFRAENDEGICSDCTHACAPELFTALGTIGGSERALREEPGEPEGSTFTPADLEPVVLWAVLELSGMFQHAPLLREHLEKIHQYLLLAVLSRLCGETRRSDLEGDSSLCAIL